MALKVLQVITPSRVSGAERSLTSLCVALRDAGHHVLIATKPYQEFVDFVQERGLQARTLGISGKVNVVAPFRLAALAREFQAEVIHTHLSTAAWHGSFAGRVAGLPVVAHVRALNTATTFRLADRVIAISQAVKAHLVRQGLDADRIDVVYTGIDPKGYRLPCGREEARERLGLPRDGPIVGIVAHLTRKKGHHVFLEAFARAVERRPDALAVFVGEGGQQPALEAQAEALGITERLRFAGYQEDVLPWYAAMDIVALPSIAREGLPRTLLEAGLMERATVSSDISGAAEIVREGKTGYLVTPDDPEALAERLVALLGSEATRDRFGARARSLISEKFTTQRMLEGTLESYRRAGVRIPNPPASD